MLNDNDLVTMHEKEKKDKIPIHVFRIYLYKSTVLVAPDFSGLNSERS